MINIFYNSEQSIDADSFSPSPRKPEQVVKEWLVKYSDSVIINDFDPVTDTQLMGVHSYDYVTGVFNGTRPNGFGNKRIEVADSLRYTSGSMLAAAKCALKEGIAVSPTSGFHHACYNGGGGFCTFNGLALTANELVNERLAERVGILDCDYHYGNGTDDIIKKLNLKFIEHYTAGGDYHGYADDGDYAILNLDFYSRDNESNGNVASRFLNNLPMRMRKFKDCDIILYQAGADPHIKDPLGGFLTTEQLKQRDEIVFTLANEMGIPVAWNLAGGYQKPLQKVLDIHNNTMSECINIYSKELA